jgi:hypothetical protein
VKTEIPLLHAGAKAVNDIRAAILDLFNIIIGKGKIVICGIVFIRVEITEDAGDITAMIKMSAHIVKTGKRNMRLLEILCRKFGGTVTKSVYRLYDLARGL